MPQVTVSIRQRGVAPGRPDRIARVIEVPGGGDDYELVIDVDEAAYTAIVQGGQPSLSLMGRGDHSKS